MATRAHKVVTFNIEPEQEAQLVEMAGPRGRSAFIRRCIAHAWEQHLKAKLDAGFTKPRRKAQPPKGKK